MPGSIPRRHPPPIVFWAQELANQLPRPPTGPLSCPPPSSCTPRSVQTQSSAFRADPETAPPHASASPLQEAPPPGAPPFTPPGSWSHRGRSWEITQTPSHGFPGPGGTEPLPLFPAPSLGSSLPGLPGTRSAQDAPCFFCWHPPPLPGPPRPSLPVIEASLKPHAGPQL